MSTPLHPNQEANAVGHTHLDSDSIVASCNCGTKTPQSPYHRVGCKYRLICERNEARVEIEALKASKAELLEALEKLIKRIEFYSALPVDQRPSIEDWEYTEGSTDMAEARAAIAKAKGVQ